MSRQALFSLIGIFVLLLAGTPAVTAPEEAWSAPVNLTGWQALVIDHRLEVGDDGTQAAFWLVRNNSGQWALWARVRPPGEEWGPPANLSNWNEYLYTVLPTYWDAGVNPDGSAVALWVAVDSAQTGDNVAVRSARRPPGGSWQAITLSAGYETAVRWADLHLGPGGHLAATWVACASLADPSQGPCHVRVRRNPAGAETWLPVEQADEAFSFEGISESYVLVGPGGLTTVLWLQADTSTPANWAVMARTFSPEPAPGAWDASPTNLSGWKKYIELSAPVTDPGGTVTAAWFTVAPDPTKRANYASTRSAATGAWSGAVSISGLVSGFRLYPPTLAAGQDGTVVAVWIYRAVSNESYLLANVRDPGSVWGAEAEIYGRSNLLISELDLGVWPGGSTMVLYSLIDTSRPKAEDETLRWTVRGSRGVWGDVGKGELTGWVTGIHGAGLQLGDDGSALAAWGLEDADRQPGEEYSVFAATWPPGGMFREPVQVADQSAFSRVRPGGLAVGRQGQPVAVLWETRRTGPLNHAVLYADLAAMGHLVYVPLGLYRSP